MNGFSSASWKYTQVTTATNATASRIYSDSDYFSRGRFAIESVANYLVRHSCQLRDGARRTGALIVWLALDFAIGLAISVAVGPASFGCNSNREPKSSGPAVWFIAAGLFIAGWALQIIGHCKFRTPQAGAIGQPNAHADRADVHNGKVVRCPRFPEMIWRRPCNHVPATLFPDRDTGARYRRQRLYRAAPCVGTRREWQLGAHSRSSPPEYCLGWRAIHQRHSARSGCCRCRIE